MSAPLDPVKVAAHIADAEAEIEALRRVRDLLQEHADDAHRDLLQRESQLAAFRQLVAERGLAGGGEG